MFIRHSTLPTRQDTSGFQHHPRQSGMLEPQLAGEGLSKGCQAGQTLGRWAGALPEWFTLGASSHEICTLAKSCNGFPRASGDRQRSPGSRSHVYEHCPGVIILRPHGCSETGITNSRWLIAFGHLRQFRPNLRS